MGKIDTVPAPKEDHSLFGAFHQATLLMMEESDSITILRRVCSAIEQYQFCHKVWGLIFDKSDQSRESTLTNDQLLTSSLPPCVQSCLDNFETIACTKHQQSQCERHPLCSNGETLTIPIIVSNDVQGVFSISFIDSHNPTEEERNYFFEFTTYLSHHLANFVKNSTQIAELKNQLDNHQKQIIQLQKMALMGQLVGGVSHDFNNILAIIIGLSQNLLKKEKLSKGNQKFLEQILYSGQRGSELVRQLLSFSSQRITVQREANLNSIINNTYKLLTRLIKENISLQTELCENIPNIMVDPTSIEQILINLMVNSSDAMPEGGKIEIVTTVISQPIIGESVCLQFRDNGSGIPREILPKIFEPFFTTKSESKGTGLGLTIVKSLVHQMNGTIDFSSTPGQGAIITIIFPVSNSQLNLPKEYPNTQPVYSTSGEKILVVEDDDLVRDMLLSTLKLEGYQPLGAVTAENALELCAKQEFIPDLLITDVMLPEKNGVWLSTNLNILLDKKIKTLFISGYSLETLQKIKKNGTLAPFLPKPFEIPLLISRIREIFDK